MKSFVNRVRTIRRWGLLVIFLVTGLVNLVRGLLVLRFAPGLRGYELSIPPTVLGGLYAIWTVLFLGEAGVCFLKIECHARYVAIFYQAMMWIVRLISDRATTIRRLWPRDLVFSLLFVALIWFLSSHQSKRQST